MPRTKKYILLVDAQEAEAKMFLDLLRRQYIPSEVRWELEALSLGYGRSTRATIYVPEESLQKAKEILGLDK